MNRSLISIIILCLLFTSIGIISSDTKDVEEIDQDRIQTRKLGQIFNYEKFYDSSAIDAYIDESNPSTSYASSTALFAGGTTGGRSYALINIDTSFFPTGNVVILSARYINYYADGASTTDKDIVINSITRS